ncbi:transcriptional regulator GlxA family with amidase domain [Herbaspirillum sp. SJZ130]|nr:transcriptional regulator GlxA family with amidase domain [Herbaspirillum sp. SJZ130]TQK14414.1 transcriptional regulator GlxA family with amidase domain [Herbaspirillum sp. SJZ106]
MGMSMATIVLASPGRGLDAASTSNDRDDPMSALRPPKRARPLVAIVADNRGTETTDLMIPQAVLARSGLAEVIVVAPEPGNIALMPALAIAAQSTLAAFDLAYPEGADYVIVPAFHHDDSKGPIIDWLKRQAASRAIIAGICEGAKVLGRAGLLDGRNATTHWYAAGELRSRHPTLRWTPHRRYVVDHGIVTTTGVSASLPVSLKLVEAIGGSGAAQALAASLGVADYGDAHDSDRYRLGAAHVWNALSNSAAVWRHETIGIPAEPGVDGIALALAADPWSRTYRSRALALGASPSVPTRDGLDLHIDARMDEARADLVVPLDAGAPPAKQLDTSLTAIAARYGHGTADLVALQLEYPWPCPSPAGGTCPAGAAA